MSISSEISRITDKRDLSFTSVSNKGVTVPSGSTIDDLPGLIDQILTYDDYTFSINSSGHLILTYSSSSAPNYNINNQGHLTFTY